MQLSSCGNVLLAAGRTWGCLLVALLLGSANIIVAAPPLRVVSFNIRGDFEHGVATSKPYVWLRTDGAHRRDLVLNAVQELDPDLLGVQEAYANQADEIAAALPKHASYGVGREDGKRAGEQCTIYFRRDRFEKIDSGTFWLCKTPEKPGSIYPGAACTRIASWVVLKDKAADRPLLVLNTHWDHVNAESHQWAAKQIREHIAEEKFPRASIVMGDFNAIEESTEIRSLLSPTDDANQLFDSYREIHPTREMNEATSHGFRLRRRGKRIDFIFHNGALVTKEASIVRMDRPGKPISDHFPVAAVLEWKP